VKIDWESFEEYFQRLEKQGSGVNLGTYVGATQVREVVIGDDDRPPTKEELARMAEMVNDAMLEGAMGVSTSLIYAPAFYANTDELIALAKVAAKHGGVYASHIRNEGDEEMTALDEAFRIGREANIPVEIFHLKSSGKQNWGHMRAVVQKIEQARASGLDVTADQYPYVASATSLGAAIPPKYHEGGTDAFIARLKDPAQREKIRAELGGAPNTASPAGQENAPKKFPAEAMWRGVGGPECVLITSALKSELKQYEGKTIAQIAQMQQKDPYDVLFDLLIAGHDQIGAIYFSMSEEDVRVAMQQPWVSVGTDYGAVNPEGPLGQSKSHPRAYGSFPRILGKYVREEKLLRLEDAIRKMTSLPAQREKLDHRGLIKQDFFADITIFDPETVIDVATFENPNRVSKGIEYVLVNGVLALDQEKMTGLTGGRPLRGPGYSLRDVLPEGLRPKGKIQGVVTTEDGNALPRTQITLVDAKGKLVGTAQTGRIGRYEMVLEKPCAGCKVAAQRAGFVRAEREVDYNGTNSLWFGFVMQPSN
jgi:dihydroorotase/N-acyl-D-amino-acid deacylase